MNNCGWSYKCVGWMKIGKVEWGTVSVLNPRDGSRKQNKYNLEIRKEKPQKQL